VIGLSFMPELSAKAGVHFQPMRIALITPYGAAHRNGNWHTAARWARFLREAGHTVRVQVEWDGRPADLMLALHARRSFAAIHAFAERFPSRPLLLALTGTDLYRDIHEDRDAQQALELAHRIIVLQDRGVDELAAHLAAKTRVIYQSAPDIARAKVRPHTFEVLVIGHLRAEKDPFRVALATSYLPEHSHIQVTHLGGALSEEMAETAELAQSKLPRWRWAGDVPHWAVLKRLARAHLMVISSVMEGGANVICEALAADVLSQNTSNTDDFSQPWAQVPQPIPLRPPNDPEGEPLGTLEGSLEDMTGRFNINNLLRLGADGKPDPQPLATDQITRARTTTATMAAASAARRRRR